MNPLFAILVVLGVLAASAFNYLLNWAPGSDREDFRIGPQGSGVTCDCFINILILGSMVVAALMVVSTIFDNRIQLYITGIFSFLMITFAGFMGRRRRRKEWEEMNQVFKRVIPSQPYSRNRSSDSNFREFDSEEED